MEEFINMIDGVRNYCDKNNIEYVFTSVDSKRRYTLLSTNVESNIILKKAVEILRTLL